MASKTMRAKWEPAARAGEFRAYMNDGSSLWITPERAFIISNAQTLWESETARTREDVENEAQRLGLLERTIFDLADDIAHDVVLAPEDDATDAEMEEAFYKVGIARDAAARSLERGESEMAAMVAAREAVGG